MLAPDSASCRAVTKLVASRIARRAKAASIVARRSGAPSASTSSSSAVRVPPPASLFPPEGQPQPTDRQGVQPAERSGGERRRQVGVEREHPERDGRGVDQGPGGRVVPRAGRCGTGGRGDLGHRERPDQFGDRGTAAGDDDHAVPRDAVEQPVFAETSRHGGHHRGTAGGFQVQDGVGAATGLPGEGRPLSTGSRGADPPGDAGDQRADRGRVPVHGAEDDLLDLRDAEPWPEAAEDVRDAAAEGGGGDVRVPERDDLHAGAGQGAEQGDLALDEFLHVVDDHQTECGDGGRQVPRSTAAVAKATSSAASRLVDRKAVTAARYSSTKSPTARHSG